MPWSEIHSLAKAEIEKLDSDIRSEIKASKEPLPAPGTGGWEQFFVLLEERGNDWGDRGCDVYLDCLRKIGRLDDQDARESAWSNGLRFFVTENLFQLIVFCCERPEGKTLLTRDNRHPFLKSLESAKISGQVAQMVRRIETRLEQKLTRGPFAPKLQAPPPLANEGESQPPTRLELVDRFMNRFVEERGIQISKRDIYRVAGYKARRDLEKWQKGQSQSGSAPDLAFTKVLALSPDEFLRRLAALKGKPAAN
jgi:hypothetical protein